VGKTKKELITAEVHRKAGPHKKRELEPVLCPKCKGKCGEADGLEGDWVSCEECDGFGSVWR
jgi:hypothetical protein